MFKKFRNKKSDSSAMNTNTTDNKGANDLGTEDQNELNQTNSENNKDSEQPIPVNEVEQTSVNPVELIQQELSIANDKYLRLYSEFDNYKKRNAKERMELIKNAGGDVIVSLLPVLDDFDRAIRSLDTATEINSVKEGVQLIHSKLNNLLNNKGLKPMDAKGKDFDPDLHEAITNVPTEDESQKGKIMDEVEKGYYLNDKVIRHAKVLVFG